MDISTLINSLPWEGLKEALYYGFSEAEFLGKNFLGLTLSNGDGLIINLNPFTRDIYNLLLISKNKYNLRSIGIFSNFDGNTYFIYEINNPSELINIVNGNIRVVYVEVIKDALEDFLYQAMGG
ncbi:MAG: hypothetical protein QXR34_04210 [Saccharolobus sp.]